MSDERTRYAVFFDRVGRHRDVAPLIVDAIDAAHLAERIHRYVRLYLASRDVDVRLDLAAQTGQIVCGFRPAGTITIELPAEAWA